MANNPLHNPTEAIARLRKKWRGDALQRPLWSIVDWPVHFENSHTRKLSRLPFVLLPTKHDGKSYRRLMRDEKKAGVFACWCLITQLAAKSPARGYLADEDGPYTALDMADMTGMDEQSFTDALSVLTGEGIRWMVKITADSLPLSPDSLPLSPDSGEQINDLQQPKDSPDVLPTTRENVGAREEKRREEKRREVPLSSPEGDNTHPVTSLTESAEKKEGGRPPAARIAADAALRILAMFPGATQLSAVCQGQIHEHVENGTLPADEKKWRALEAMRAERSAIPGTPDDFDLRSAWLISKERLCRDLAEALDTALAKRPQATPGARTRGNMTTPPAGDWRSVAKKKWPDSDITDATEWTDLPAHIRLALIA